MLLAKRTSDGETVQAYFERKENGPFLCPDCNERVVLRTGRSRINHFAHENPFACEYANNESDAHRHCKMEIYQALLQERGVADVAIERPCGPVRPDVSAVIRGVRVAIEIQISSLSVETIMQRTIEYHKKGIYVLWLLQWTPELDLERYAPSIWEKWIHACYFGRVYYWTQGLNVVEYQFKPDLKTVPKSTWFSKDGKRMTSGGYAVRSVRFRHPSRGKTYNIAKDFGPRLRYWWEGGGIKVPDARLFTKVL